MKSYRYIIIGGGMAAHAAVQGIREVDPHSPIGVFGQETDPPYRRPALSKDVWKGEDLDSAMLEPFDENTDLHLGERITEIHPAKRTVTNTQNESYEYEKLLLATGGRVRHLPFDDTSVQYYRTTADYKKLHAETGKGREFLVIGGGFIGSEIAAALAMTNEKVTMVFPDRGISGRIFPRELASWLNDYFREKGVVVKSGTVVTGVQEKDGRVEVTTSNAETLTADTVVAGIGIEPETLLAEEADLETDNGIVVDSFLRTSEADIYAAGDVAAFRNPALADRMRVEHEDNALSMGRLAGKNMALHHSGRDAQPYNHLPMFYSDLFDLGYEAVGQLDSRLDTVIDWAEPFKRGIVYYLDDDRVRGVLLWNVWEKVDEARALIAKPGPLTKDNFKDWRLSMD